MKAEPTDIPAVIVFQPTVIDDTRGHFFESYHQARFNEAVGKAVGFVQDNQSYSKKDVIRGLHWQLAPHEQGKLVRVVKGEIFDVAVDLRQSSPTFCRYVSAILSSENKRQLWIPEGFAHGFQVLSDGAEVIYKATNYWSAPHERSVAWNDPGLDIAWPNKKAPILSAKDGAAPPLSRLDCLPTDE